MGIEVQINGKIILNVIGLSVRSSVATLSSDFLITVSPGKNATQKVSNLNFKRGDTAVIQIDGKSVVNGFIDNVEVRYSSDRHKIELTGRDRTADFIDSSVAATDIETPIKFKELLRITLDNMGLQTIGITDLLPPSADTTIRETKNISSEIGQTGFEFIDQFARLKQILLKGDGAGNIQMTRGGGDQRINTPLVNSPSTEQNNIISGIFVESGINRFNKYTVKSQEDFSSPGFDLDPGDAVDNSGEAIDTQIRASRNLVFEAEENSTAEECKNRAAWESDARRAFGTKLVVTVREYSVVQTDELGTSTVLWEPNAKVFVMDVFSNIRSYMLIESVHYQLSQVTGSTTDITLVPVDAYLVLAARDATEARNSLIGKEDE